MGEFVRFPSTFWTTIAQRPEEARGKVFTRYQQPILAFIKKRVHDEHLAEDLSQDVFKDVCTTEFLKKADRERGKFRNLLLGVVRNKIGHALAKGERRRALSIEQGGRDGGPIDPPGGSTFDEDDFARGWGEHILVLARERLQKESTPGKPRYYDAHILSSFKQLTCAEISKKLGASESTVNNWIHVAKEKLIKYGVELIQEYSSSEDEYRDEITRFFPDLPEPPPPKPTEEPPRP